MSTNSLISLLIVALSMLPSRLQAQEERQQDAQREQTQEQSPPQEDEEKEAEELPRYEEVVIVTASKVEEELINAPASVSVVTSQRIESSPAQNYGDLLRTVPGVNVAQTSARDVNIVSRGATNTLATSQLALLDGRSIYLDFFGFVAWDFMPVNMGEIKQIEVIRGPASAVWGANAMTGVVNIITKSPREMEGTSVTVGFGGVDRSVPGNDLGTGGLFSVNATHAQSLNERWAYKVSGGVFTQDTLPRPTGIVPPDPERGTGGAPYPAFANQGTTQPKFDARFDYDFGDGRQSLIFAGGLAGTEGIVHTGIGPFDIQSGTILGYAKVNYERDNLKLNFFTNVLDGEAPALLAIGTTGQPINFLFENQTYDVEVGNSHVLGARHILSYGGNFRHNGFDLSIAPRGDNRDEGGGYVQDEIFFSDKLRWVIGGRVDKFEVLDDVVFSPRTTFMFKPRRDQAIRFSFNRAFRAPSFINNFLDTVILNQLDLGLIDPRLAGRSFIFPTAAVGNEHLEEESLTAYEISYTGTFANRATVTAAVYRNETRDGIFFTQSANYSSANPPPGWPLPPPVLDLLSAAGRALPAQFTYLNFNKFTDTGVELSVTALVSDSVDVFGNYSWQDEPEPKGFDISELNIPPRHRFNLGFNYNTNRYFGSTVISFTDSAFWTDVLDARFHGSTDSFTVVNGTFGRHWAEGRVRTSIKANNIGNTDVQHHIFGDILKVQVTGEVQFHF